MKKTIYIVLVMMFTNLLGACGGGHKEPELTIKSMADLQSAGKGIVVLLALAGEKGYAKKAMGSTWALNGLKDNMTAAEKSLTTKGYGRNTSPLLAQLTPGTYSLMKFHYRIGRGGRTVINKAGMNGFPLASFTVKAGDIIYLGNFIAHTTTNTALFNTTRHFDLTIENDQKTARAWLAKQTPELAAQMKTRLIKISPLFETMKKIAGN